jgi:hypothetical protein
MSCQWNQSRALNQLSPSGAPPGMTVPGSLLNNPGAFPAESDIAYPATPGIDLFDYGPGLDEISTGSAVGPASSSPIPLSGQNVQNALPALSVTAATNSAGSPGVPSSYPYGPGVGPTLPPGTLTIAQLGQPSFPNISATFQSVPLPPSCDWWANLNAAIAANPLVASAVLIGAVALIAHARGKRGR